MLPFRPAQKPTEPEPLGERNGLTGYDDKLSCPECRGAVRLIEGRYGPFFGCVKYPDCKGKLNRRAAEQQVREYIGCDEPDDDDRSHPGWPGYYGDN